MSNIINYTQKIYTGTADIFDAFPTDVFMFRTLSNFGYFLPQLITYIFVSRGSGGTGSAAPTIRTWYTTSANTIHTPTAVSTATPAAGTVWNFAPTSGIEIPPNSPVYVRNGSGGSDSYDSWIVRYYIYGFYGGA